MGLLRSAVQWVAGCSQRPGSAREGDPNEAGQRRLAEAVGSDRALWPVRGPNHSDSEQTWTEELFHDVVEALHDRVADKLALKEILREHGSP